MVQEKQNTFRRVASFFVSAIFATFISSLFTPSNLRFYAADALPLEAATAQEAAAVGVIERLLGPVAASRFQFRITEEAMKNSADVYRKEMFEVVSQNGVVKVTGTSGVALTAGAYQYLKQSLGASMTWGEDGSGDQLDTVLRYVALNQPWPDFNISKQAMVPLRYGWNMCTFSYTAPWWNETRWQREIDWMALHGVNMPLAVTGVEYIWYKVYVEKYNVSLATMQEWFSGPAFLTWQRMGNVRSFAGPLSLQWINRQKDLNVFILQAMRSLGMRPVLSCFAGHVPAVAKTLFPEEDARFHRSDNWMGFPDEYTGVWHVEPTAKAYQTLGKAFMEAQKEVYGETDFYNCDTFNEVDPKSSEQEALASAATAVVSSIRSVNPSGIWVMQGWLFYFSGFWRKKERIAHYLSGAKTDEMIILDLNADQVVVAEQNVDRNYEFYGKKWIYNMLHNFGGVHDIYGNYKEIYERLPKKVNVEWANCVGLGITAEAVEHNAFMYEAYTDLFFNGYYTSKTGDQLRAALAGDNSNYGPLSFIPSMFRHIPLNEWAHTYGLQRHGAYAPLFLNTLTDGSNLDAGRLETLQSLSSELGHVFLQTFHSNGEGGTFLRSFLDHNPHFPARRVGQFTRAVSRLKGALHGIRVGLRIAEITDAVPTYPTDAKTAAELAAKKAPSKKHRPIHTDLIDLTFVVAHALHEINYDIFSQLLLSTQSEAGKKLISGSQAENVPPRRLSYGPVRMLNRTLMRIYDELDVLANSDPNYLLGRWLQRARSMAYDLGPTNKKLLENPATSAAVKDLFTPAALKKEADLYDYNARNIVSLWAPKSGMALEGYARRLWAGLFKDVYKRRQGLVLNMLAQRHPNPGSNEVFDELRGGSNAWAANGAKEPNQYSAFPTDHADVAADPWGVAGSGLVLGTAELVRKFVRDLVYLSSSEIEKRFEKLPPTSTVAPKKGVWEVELPTRIKGMVGFVASLCFRSIGPSCLGFDMRRNVLYVRLYLDSQEVAANPGEADDGNILEKIPMFEKADYQPISGAKLDVVEDKSAPPTPESRAIYVRRVTQ